MTHTAPLHFADFDAEGFLRDYWQKKPLLIRNPWAEWSNPIEPDELAGLGCEPDVESRLISLERDDLALEHGPLPDNRFDELGRAPWTLLVQAVDHHVPAVADLIEPFRFIPNWRIDDVMVSYATDGGGVGAHFDQYDVFLVQGLGRRRWELGQMCDNDTPLLPHDDLRLLAEFVPEQEWVLEPGDILYVPPRLAHRGTAIGHDCMTYSVGFRAPSVGELIEGWTDEILDTLDDDERYADPDLALQSNPGEISAPALGRMQEAVLKRIADPQAFAQWFGKLATAPKNPNIEWQPDEPLDPEEVAGVLGPDSAIIRNPASRFAFIRTGEDAVLLAVDAECTDCTGEAAVFAQDLCASPRLHIGQASAPVRALVSDLYNRGCIAFEAGDQG